MKSYYKFSQFLNTCYTPIVGEYYILGSIEAKSIYYEYFLMVTISPVESSEITSSSMSNDFFGLVFPFDHSDSYTCFLFLNYPSKNLTHFSFNYISI